MKKITLISGLFLVVILISGCTTAKINSVSQPTTKEINSTSEPATNCVILGGSRPNGSIGPNDPNKDKMCCEGLVLKNPKKCATESEDDQRDCLYYDGCGTVCIKCGDNFCDSQYENKCNCPDDCN